MRTAQHANHETVDLQGSHATPPLLQPETASVSRVTVHVGVGIAIFVVVGLTGCQRALFPSDLPRNQFETHDRMRQAYTPLEEPDVFGTPQPALRARLTQQTGSGT